MSKFLQAQSRWGKIAETLMYLAAFAFGFWLGNYITI